MVRDKSENNSCLMINLYELICLTEISINPKLGEILFLQV